MKASGTVNAIVIEQGHRWHFQRNGTLNELFRLGCSLEEAECAGSMQLYIAFSHRALSSANGLA
jgi:hypothetical protein